MLSQIKIGDVVQFVYEGGNNPGSIRTVKVESCDDRYICGICYFADGYRRFDASKIRNLQSFDKKSKIQLNNVSIGAVYNNGLITSLKISNNINRMYCTFKIKGGIFVDDGGNTHLSINDIINKLNTLR